VFISPPWVLLLDEELPPRGTLSRGTRVLNPINDVS